MAQQTKSRPVIPDFDIEEPKSVPPVNWERRLIRGFLYFLFLYSSVATITMGGPFVIVWTGSLVGIAASLRRD